MVKNRPKITYVNIFISKPISPETFVFKRFRTYIFKAPPRFELGNRGFADLGLTTWLWRHIVIEKFKWT